MTYKSLCLSNLSPKPIPVLESLHFDKPVRLKMKLLYKEVSSSSSEAFLTMIQSFSQLSLTMTSDIPDQCSDYSCSLSLEFALSLHSHSLISSDP